MRHALTALVGAAFLLFCAAPARAEPIPWFYSWSRTPTVICADNSSSSYVALGPASQAEQIGTSAAIEATNIFHYGGKSNGPPAEFSGGAADQFTLTLHIYDPSVAAPGTVTFNGDLYGYLTSTTSHIQSYYSGVTTKSLTLGKHLYTIQLSTYAPSGSDCTTASVTAIATVTVQNLPEPASAVLALLALPAAFLWKRRRRAVSLSH
ncbi:MAG TPA: hypothetical protein VMS17_10675 [Gemmataceae bacterium]|nr:hypothetical protein [Gemmataceae bacterium]